MMQRSEMTIHRKTPPERRVDDLTALRQRKSDNWQQAFPALFFDKDTIGLHLMPQAKPTPPGSTVSFVD
jgi:hypothetical protein